MTDIPIPLVKSRPFYIPEALTTFHCSKYPWKAQNVSSALKGTFLLERKPADTAFVTLVKAMNR